MAVMTHRTTFALDGATVRRLKRLASRWKVSQAEVIRRAVAQAEVQPDPLPDDPVSMLRRLHESSEALGTEASQTATVKALDQIAFQIINSDDLEDVGPRASIQALSIAGAIILLSVGSH